MEDNIPIEDAAPSTEGTLTLGREASNEQTSRFNGAPWFSTIKNISISIFGCGGIGSYLAFYASRLRPGSISLYDFDHIEEGNLAGQLFSSEDVGLTKVGALSMMMRNYSEYYQARIHTMRVDSHTPISRATLCGFDNMTARADAFSAFVARISECSPLTASKYIFIDGRLNAENYQIFAFCGTDTARMRIYQDKWLFSDDEADPTVCSYKQTSFCAGMLAGHMISILVNMLTNEAEGAEVRDVPFLTEVDLTQGFFKFEY